MRVCCAIPRLVDLWMDMENMDCTMMRTWCVRIEIFRPFCWACLTHLLAIFPAGYSFFDSGDVELFGRRKRMPSYYNTGEIGGRTSFCAAHLNSILLLRESHPPCRILNKNDWIRYCGYLAGAYDYWCIADEFPLYVTSRSCIFCIDTGHMRILNLGILLYVQYD